MSDRKISELAPLSATGVSDGDFVFVVDINEPSLVDKNKRLEIGELFGYIKTKLETGGESVFLVQGPNSVQEGYFNILHTNILTGNTEFQGNIIRVQSGTLLSLDNITSEDNLNINSGGVGKNIIIAPSPNGALVLNTENGTGNIELRGGEQGVRIYKTFTNTYVELNAEGITGNRRLNLANGTTTLVDGTMVPTSRTLEINTSNGISGGLAAQDLSGNRTWNLGLEGQTLGLHNLNTNGLVTRAASDVIVARSIGVSGNGLSIANGDGVLGNPTITLNSTNLNTPNTVVVRDASGNFNAGTISAQLNGNASTATALQSAQNINNTSFNGTENIVTTIWGQTRNITIGNTTLAVNGSTGYTWSLNDIGVNNATLTLNTTGLVSSTQTWTANQGTNASFTVNVPATNLSVAGGTTSGPTINSSTGTNAQIPVASGTASGVVTTGTQTFAGAKTFSSTITGSISGNAATATTWATGRTITLTGDVSGTSGTFNGSANLSFSTALANTGVAAGTYTKLTVDTKGRVTVGANLAEGDIPSLTASKISNFDTQVRTNRLDQLAAPTSSVGLNNQRITNLAEPTSSADAATKAYVDANQQGLVVKDSARAATTANITLSGTQTIDGVAVIAGNRVLVKNQSTESQNGIYVVAAGAWSRSADADTSGEVTTGMFVFVEEGTVNANSGWVLTTPAPITLDTTALNFAKFSGAGQIEGGAGLIKTGSTLDVVTASSARIVVNADSIDLATAGTAGTYKSVTTDAYGRVTSGTNPTTLAGYGITDAATSTHTHGNITNAGAIGSTANLPIITGTSGALQVGSFGTTANTFCQGNDSRLSDARTPTSHTHGNISNEGQIGSTANLPIITGTGGILEASSFGTTANTFCQGNDARLSDARTPTSHTHGNITNDGKIGATATLPIITTTGGTLTTGSFGSSAGTFCQGNDARLSDTRNTTNSITFNNSGSGAASGTTFNGSVARTISYNTVGAPSTGGANASGTWGISVSGNAATATALATARTINGTSFDGTSNITVTALTTNAVTFNNSGSGVASGTTFDGAVARTISFNTIGAPSVSGTNATGSWNINITGNAASASIVANEAITNSMVATDAAINGTKINPSFGAQDILFGSGNRSIVNTSNNALILSTNNTERARITNTGRFGIGTTTPYASFSIRGVNNQISLDLDTTVDGSYSGIGWNGSTADLDAGPSAEIRGYRIGAQASGALAFHTRPGNAGSFERARIDENGRFLIGTSSSRTAKVGSTDINLAFQIEATTFANASITRFTSDTTSSGFYLQKSRGTTAAPTTINNTDNIGVIYFSGYSGTDFLNSAAIQASVDGTPAAGTVPGLLSFRTTSSGASVTERMVIRANGNVGINNASPNEILDVTGNIKASGNLLGAAFIPSSSTVPTNGVYLPAANRVGISTNSTLRAFIDGDGKINIAGTNALNEIFAINAAAGGYLIGTTGARSVRVKTQYASSVTGDQEDFVASGVGGNSDTAYTTAAYRGFRSENYIKGTNQTLTNCFGFFAGLQSAGENNYGFYSNTSSAAGRWNFYAAGTAPNYFNGDVRTTSTYIQTLTATNANGNVTATASSLISGLRTGTPTGGVNLQVPTGTNMDSAFQNLDNNQAFKWFVQNNAASTHNITVTSNTNHTLFGNMVVAPQTIAQFLTRKTGTNTFVTLRIN